ncbi:MAG: transporter substrate-binding domain-containing protein, partial [Enterobacteriaceae bacterium]
MIQKKLFFVAVLGGLLLSATSQANGEISIQAKNAELYAQLPESIKKQGVIINVFDGANPPFVMTKGEALEGAAIDLTKSLSEVLGIKIENRVVDSFSGMIAGIQSGRYQLSTALIGDFPDRHEKMDF